MIDDAARQEHKEYLCAPWAWRGVIRRSDLPKWAKYILLAAADRADADGTSITVGVALLAVEAESSYNRTQEALRMARRCGLLFLAREGNRRRRIPAEWWLIMHPEFMEHVRVESPDSQKQRAASMRADKRESWTASKKPDDADESCTPGECMNEDDDTPIMHPSGVHDPETSCTPGECTKPESCTRPGSENGGSCTRPGGPTTKEQGDLNHTTPTPSDENDLSRPVTLRATEAVEEDRFPSPLLASTEPPAALAPAVCEHFLPAGLRPDGKPNCVFCRQRAARAEAGPGEAEPPGPADLVWMATPRRGLEHHQLRTDQRATLCGRSTRTGERMPPERAAELDARPCTHCQTARAAP